MPTTLLTLPPELHLLIITHLPFPSSVSLKLTCTYFHATIPPLTTSQLLKIEESTFAINQDLYACRYCRRLRPGYKFADRMKKKGRGRRGHDSEKRFCVECGLQPRGERGEARYSRGAQVIIQGVFHVLCIECGKFVVGMRVRCKECMGKRMLDGH
ncbi:hypothetical protein BDV12DRAFT_161605 [Aspergillus spectabilis]